MNIVDNIFIEEFKYFKQNGVKIANCIYDFKGNAQEFTVEICKGSKPIVFKKNTFMYITVDGSILSQSNIDYLLEYRYYQCVFDNVSLKDKEITQDLNQTRFFNCYFRKTKFDNIKLIGSKFIECNFNSAQFVSVILDNVEFIRSNILFNQLEECIPMMHSKDRVKLTRNLLSNALAINITDDARVIKDSMKEY